MCHLKMVHLTPEKRSSLQSILFLGTQPATCLCLHSRLISLNTLGSYVLHDIIGPLCSSALFVLTSDSFPFLRTRPTGYANGIKVASPASGPAGTVHGPSPWICVTRFTLNPSQVWQARISR